MSLGKQLEALTQLILDWRKIELEYVGRKLLCNSKLVSALHAVNPEYLVSICSLQYLCCKVELLSSEVFSYTSMCVLM